MQKLVNFRPLFVVFLGLILGIFITSQYVANVFLFAFNLETICLGLILISLLGYLIFYKKTHKFFAIKRIVIILFLIAYITGAFCFVNNYNDFTTQDLYGDIYTIEGEIESTSSYNEEKIIIYINNGIATKDEISIDLSKMIKLYVTCYDEQLLNLKQGNKIIFTSEIKDYELIDNGEINGYIYENNLGYYASAVQIDLEIFEEDNNNIAFNIRENVKDFLFNNLSYDTASISYAMLFGDKEFLSSNTYDTFKMSGIAHILAVSGLHIGFLVLLIVLLLNTLKINKKVSFLIILLLLYSYAYICGFPASVVRASIMALVLMLGGLLGERNDNLSSLSLSGIIILLISPLSLYSVGFLLSMVSVFTIFMLYKPFTSFFRKLNLPEWISVSLAITLSAQIGTLPICAHYFNQFAVLSVFTNVIVLPLFSVAYVSLVCGVIFGFIFSAFGFVLALPNLLLSIILIIAKLIGNLSFSTVFLFSFGILASVIYMLSIFICSGYVMLKNNKKIIVTSILVVLCVISAIWVNLPTNYNYYSLTKIEGVENSGFITTSSNEKYLVNIGVGDDFDKYNIENFLLYNKVLELDALIIADYTQEKQDLVVELIENYNIKKLFIPCSSNNILVFGIMDALPVYTQFIMLNNNEETIENNIVLTSYIEEEQGYALSVAINNFTILFAGAENSYSQKILFNNILSTGYDIAVLNSYYFEVANLIVRPTYILVQENFRDVRPSILYDANTFGNLRVMIEYDKITLID